MSSSVPSPTGSVVLVGVHSGQLPAVVLEAAKLAAALDCPLVCAYANPARFAVQELDDGTVIAEALDPDYMDQQSLSGQAEEFPEQLAGELAEALQLCRVPWRSVLLAGDPARALAHCAETVGASMIVVGTHADTRTPLREILRLSVAAHLTRLASCPILVVPVHRDGTDKGRQ
ncbi:universal stress protein [Arthrobacter psychrolactophilus]|uniref:Universal stress protein n=1 Tax=Arthrobacter psychrolactophilus TaxID=92442 RepID=A0A2V5IPP4_9MICC|nr:universal stress protein [Arthrobacter psychrolactophilus]PYI38559.1 universal stress protein [Arthrobacter psychrolactophilus]